MDNQTTEQLREQLASHQEMADNPNLMDSMRAFHLNAVERITKILAGD